MYITTTRLIEMLKSLKIIESHRYWIVTEVTQWIDTVIGRRFNEEAYNEAVEHNSLSDTMWPRPVNRKHYEEDIIEKKPISVKQYALDLGAFLRANDYEPEIFRDFIKSDLNKNFTINFDGCRDLVRTKTEHGSNLMKHLQMDFISFSQKLNSPIELPPLKDKLHEILISFHANERKDLYKNATPIFKAIIVEFFPEIKRAEEEEDRRAMAKLQSSRDAFFKANPNKREAPETSLFWNRTQAAKLSAYEKKYKVDPQPEAPRPPGN